MNEAQMTAEAAKMKSPTRPVRLLKFGGLSCPACIAMERAKVLERIADEYAQLEIVRLDVNNEEHEVPEGSIFEENYKLSDEYKVETLPTLIFEDTETGDELTRFEGALSFRDLKKLTAAALEEREERVARRALSKKVKSP